MTGRAQNHVAVTYKFGTCRCTYYMHLVSMHVGCFSTVSNHRKQSKQVSKNIEQYQEADTIALSALTLLAGRQEENVACKNGVTRCWCGYLSKVRCNLFAYCPADATPSQNPIISCLI